MKIGKDKKTVILAPWAKAEVQEKVINRRTATPAENSATSRGTAPRKGEKVRMQKETAPAEARRPEDGVQPA